MWEEGVFLGVKGSTGEIIVGNEKGVWVTRTVRRKPEEERWDRTNIEKIVGVPWKNNEQDANADGDGMRGEVKIMDKEYRERMEAEEEHVAMPRRIYIKKDDLEKHGYMVGCPGCVSILKGTARQAHSEACRKRMETELKNTDRSKAAERRVDEYLEKAIKKDEEKREIKRRKADGNGGENAKNDAKDDVQMKDLDNRLENKASVGASSGSQDVMMECKGEKRSYDEGVEKRTVKFLRKLEKMEGKTRHEGDCDSEGIMAVTNDEAVEMEPENVDELFEQEDVLDPELVKKGRAEETEYMVKKLDMFEFGDHEEAKMKGGGKEPTTTKWVEGKKVDDDGEEFVRCRLVGRDFKPRCEAPRDDLFAAMPPLEAKKVLFAMVAGERGRRRRKKLKEMKLMFIDVKKAHLNARCDEQAWVELPSEFWEWGRYARLRRWLYGMRKAAAGWEDDYAEKLEGAGFKRGIGAPTVFYNEVTNVRVVVHGDDFTFAGIREELEKMKVKLAEWYEIKMRGIMGSAADEVKAIKILGRTVRWTSEGLSTRRTTGTAWSS